MPGTALVGVDVDVDVGGVGFDDQELAFLETTTDNVPVISRHRMFQLLPENNKYQCKVVCEYKDDSLQGLQLEAFLNGSRDVAELPDPIQQADTKSLVSSIQEMLSSDVKVLSTAATHLFEHGGKHIRPTIVSLVGKALLQMQTANTYYSCPAKILRNSGDENYLSTSASFATNSFDSYTSSDAASSSSSSTTTTTATLNPISSSSLSPALVQAKLAKLGQVVEMIHVGSLIHDDVLDDADTRRGAPAVHQIYSNKVAILSGDFVLARAYVAMARLGNPQVIQLISYSLEALVSGEILQLEGKPEQLLQLESYLRKSYFKTASLIAHACCSAAILAGHPYGSTWAEICLEFGFHLGLAFQIQDDILDLTSNDNVLGKPTQVDLDLGLGTAPILYAAQEFPELNPIIMRRFKQPGDKQMALERLAKSKLAMSKARDLAKFHAQVCIPCYVLHSIDCTVSSYGTSPFHSRHTFCCCFSARWMSCCSFLRPMPGMP